MDHTLLWWPRFQKKDGRPLVHKLTCAVDAGISIRPNQIEAQIEGGLLDGFTSAMFQKITFKNGAVQQDNFDTYRLLRFENVPLVYVQILKTNHPPSGVGETSIFLAAPAIANAFARATGKRLRQLPFLDVWGSYFLLTKNEVIIFTNPLHSINSHS
jgi:isoquinoline 1-oxidoreductase subunit beta